MRHRTGLFAAALAVCATSLLLLGPASHAQSSEAELPTVIKTRPTFVADVLAQSQDPAARRIAEGDIVRVEVVARGDARGDRKSVV